MRIQVSARGCYFFCRLAGRGSTLPILRRILYEAGLANERENLAPNFLFTPLSALIMCRFCVRAVWVCAWQGLLFNFSERSPLKTCSLPTGVTWSGSKQTAIERTSDRTKQRKKREKSVRWKSSLSLEIIKEISSPTHTHTGTLSDGSYPLQIIILIAALSIWDAASVLPGVGQHFKVGKVKCKLISPFNLTTARESRAAQHIKPCIFMDGHDSFPVRFWLEVQKVRRQAGPVQ